MEAYNTLRFIKIFLNKLNNEKHMLRYIYCLNRVVLKKTVTLKANYLASKSILYIFSDDQEAMMNLLKFWRLEIF